MTQPVRHLQAVDPDTGELAENTPSYPEALSLLNQLHDKILGYQATIDSQAAKIGRLTKTLEEADPATHPQHAQMASLVNRWKRGANHPKARISRDRIDYVKARLKDKYDFPELELSVDGLCAFPYVRQGQRTRTGEPRERHDRFGICMESGEQVEKFAVLGHTARKNGWVTWDDYNAEDKKMPPQRANARGPDTRSRP